MKRHTILIVITLILAGMLSCSSGDTATVTIDTGIRKQAQLTVWDKVLAWITLSQPVKADPVPIELYQIDSIAVTISASDMGTIKEAIQLETGRITLEVPAGSQRTFEVVATTPDYPRFYGGIATVDLSAGQQVALNIEMGKLTIVEPHWDYYTHSNVNIIYYTDYPEPQYFKVYENVGDPEQIFVLFDTILSSSLPSEPGEGQTTYFYTNSTINEGNYVKFYISAVSKYGEGERNQISE
ncbi:MAG TPA: hypothetical protein PLZ38_12380 [Spirochaetota bacterium]|nr:hypothetical protein [Spirochaetota bacterium]